LRVVVREALIYRHQVRLTGLTALALLLFLGCHWSVVRVIDLIQHSSTFLGVSAAAPVLRVLLFSGLAYLYLRAWIELSRMIYERWVVPRLKLSRPGPKSRTTNWITTEQAGLWLLAAVICVTIFTGDAFDHEDIRRRGLAVGVLVAVGGPVVIVCMSWFIRQLEPYLPFN
jgi:hypothetical protein